MSESASSVSDRIALLERRVRRLTAGLVLVPACALLVGAAANEVIRTKSVTTERLIIVDSAGMERAALYCGDKQEPVLEFYNADHSLILNAGKSPDNGVGFLQYFDASGKFKGGVGGNSVN